MAPQVTLCGQKLNQFDAGTGLGDEAAHTIERGAKQNLLKNIGRLLDWAHGPLDRRNNEKYPFQSSRR